MSIKIEFTAKLRNKSKLIPELKRLSAKYGCRMGMREQNIMLIFCNCGIMKMTVGDTRISGSAQTNIAGAGFHAAAVDLLCELEDNTNMDIHITDPTGYCLHKNFNRLKKEHMNVWLSSILRIPMERPVSAYQYCMGYDANSYMPENIGGTVVTPVGRFSIAGLKKRIAEKGIEDFARDFFIWSNREKDALYSRNNALYLMATLCCFKPSERSESDKNANGAVLAHLEKALELDRNLPFPKKEYLEICALAGQEPKDIEDVPEMETEYPIGYRRSDVVYRMGNLNVTLPGDFLTAADPEDECQLFTNGEKTDRITVRMKAVRTTTPPELDSEIFKDSTGPVVDFDCGAGRCRMGNMRRHDEVIKKDFFTTCAVVVCDMQASIVSISYENEKDRVWAERTIRRMNAVSTPKAQ